jgi:hypothetical protein
LDGGPCGLSATRARLTFETLDRKNWDEDFIEKRLAFGKLRQTGQVAIYAGPPPPEVEEGQPGEKERESFLQGVSAIQAILNDYENIAIGIRRGILDEEFLFRYMRSGLIRDWEAASPYVIALRARAHIPQIYVEFEGLAAQWQNDMSYRHTTRTMPKRQRVVSVR